MQQIYKGDTIHVGQTVKVRLMLKAIADTKVIY